MVSREMVEATGKAQVVVVQLVSCVQKQHAIEQLLLAAC